MMPLATRFAPAVMLGLGALMINGVRVQHAVPPVKRIAEMPADLGGLSSRDRVIDAEERRVAGMSDYVLREYVRDSVVQFSLYVGYYDRQVQGKAIHSPKNCLPGAGWEILESQRVALKTDVATGSVNRVLLMNKGNRALVYYWYQGRGRVEASEYKVKWNLMRDAAIYGRTEESLVRIVVPIGSGAPESLTSADRLATRLLPKIYENVAKVMPSMPSA